VQQYFASCNFVDTNIMICLIIDNIGSQGILPVRMESVAITNMVRVNEATMVHGQPTVMVDRRKM
jgi:hypothetical protein